MFIQRVMLMFLLFLASIGFAEYAAVVNGVTINLQAFDAVYKGFVNDYKNYSFLDEEHGFTVEDRERLKYSVLDHLVEDTLIQRFAEEKSLMVTDQEIRNRVDKLKRGFPSVEDFWRALKEQRLTFERLAENVQYEMLKEKIVAEAYPDQQLIATSDVLAYLRKNNLFLTPVQYNITLLVSDNVRYLKSLIDTDIQKEWNSLAIDTEHSLQAKEVYEEDLPLTVSDELAKIELYRFSEVLEFDENQFFVVRINKMLNLESFDLNSISTSVKDSLKQEKQNEYFQRWLENRRLSSNIVFNQEIFPDVDEYIHPAEDSIPPLNQQPPVSSGIS